MEQYIQSNHTKIGSESFLPIKEELFLDNNIKTLINRFNTATNKLNALDGDVHIKLFDTLPLDFKGDIALEHVEYLEKHYLEMNDRYKEFKLGIYSISPYQYGELAFKNGKKRIPAHDHEFCDAYIAGIRADDSNEPIQQWLDGWDNANLYMHR